jgi:phosphoglycolate phosphatase
MNAVEALLLDLDGTLLDTAPDMGGALNRLLAEEGRAPLEFAVIRPVVSHGAMRLVRLGFPAAEGDDFERLRLRFLALYATNLAEHTRPFPGLLDVLDQVERMDVPWGIVTNKPGWLTTPLLAQLELDQRASVVVSGDTVAERKPHPLPLLHAAETIRVMPQHCVYVGDAERDIQAGRAAGMRTVVAAYGYIGADEDPTQWAATGIVDEPAELLRWVRPGRREARVSQ